MLHHTSTPAGADSRAHLSHCRPGSASPQQGWLASKTQLGSENEYDFVSGWSRRVTRSYADLTEEGQRGRDESAERNVMTRMHTPPIIAPETQLRFTPTGFPPVTPIAEVTYRNAAQRIGANNPWRDAR